MSKHDDDDIDFLSVPLRDDQQELVDDLRAYGDDDSARECSDFFRGWNAAENE